MTCCPPSNAGLWIVTLPSNWPRVVAVNITGSCTLELGGTTMVMAGALLSPCLNEKGALVLAVIVKGISVQLTTDSSPEHVSPMTAPPKSRLP